MSVSAEKRSSSHWIWSPPTLEPPRVRSVAADLSRFLRGKSRYQDTQSTIVFPVNNSSHSLFNLRSCGVEPGHSYNLETTAPKLATAPLVAAQACNMASGCRFYQDTVRSNNIHTLATCNRGTPIMNVKPLPPHPRLMCKMWSVDGAGSPPTMEQLPLHCVCTVSPSSSVSSVVNEISRKF